MLNVEALIPEDWKLLLGDYLASQDWQQLQANLQNAIEADANAICPPPPLFFRALEITPVDWHFQYLIRLCRAHAAFRAPCGTSAKLWN
jgi:hypothetical protein